MFEARVERLFTPQVGLGEEGFARLPGLLRADECERLAAGYDDERAFRKTGGMARHGFGRGEKRHFAEPVPVLVSELRAALYAKLAPIANRWWEQLGVATHYPATLAE